MIFMAAEYSYPLTQTVAVNENILFLNGDRCCKKGFIVHNDASGVFRLKGICKNCAPRAIYKVNFHANVAVAPADDGGVLEPITLALTQNGEVQRNTVSVVTPAAIRDQWVINFETLIELPCGCCDTISVRNISATTAIEVENANILFERIA
jgi:hypothetical protein